ncbi:MAG: glycosyltransferase family 2 protein [Alphaproteobacteria bacterium]|nr:MAG: glycosyltransferase family 2 protein [Alphaproteobacteria bacterium]
MSETSAPILSFVIPARDEEGNIEPLVAEIKTATQRQPLVGENYEIIIVDDGSRDGTAKEALACRASDPRVRVIRHSRPLGQSRARRNGIAAARGAWVMTMDGDGQNDPSDLPRLFDTALDQEHMAGRGILLAGLRVHRHDAWSKRVASAVANSIRKMLLKDGCPDSACGVKLFRPEHHMALPFFEGMHRYEPALFKLYGHHVALTTVRHRPRRRGHTKYTNWRRGLVGIVDVLGVLWLKSRTASLETGVEAD